MRTNDVAAITGWKQQNVSSLYNSPDVPSGKLEAIAEALGKDMSFWYPEIKQGNTYNNSGNAGRDINQGAVEQNAELIERIIAENKQLQENNNALTTTNAQLSQIIANLTRH